MSQAAPPPNRYLDIAAAGRPETADGGSGARAKRLLRVSLLGILLKGVGVLLAFASQLVLARVLGVNAFGVYVTILAWTTVLSLLGGFGMPLASVRFLASYSEALDWPRYRGFLRASLRLTLMSSVTIGCLVLVVFAAVPMLRPSLSAMASGVALIGLLSVSGLGSGTFLSAQLPLHAEAFGNVSRPLLVILLVGGVAWLGSPVGAITALGLTVLAAVLVVLVQIIGLWPIVAPRWRGPRDVAEWRPWVASGVAFLMTTAAYSLVERLDTILLSALVSPAAAGPYTVASRLALLVGVALAPVSALLGPMGAQLLTRGDRDGLQRVLAQGALLTTGLAVCFATGLLLFAPLLLSLFGKDFAEGGTVLPVLVSGQVVLAMVGPAGYILAIAGHNRLLIAVSLLTAALDAVLCLVLIPRFGPLGASLATAASIAVNGLALAAVTRWKVRVDTTLLAAVGLLVRRKAGPI